MHCIGIQASAGLSSSIIGLAGQPRMFALKLYGGKKSLGGPATKARSGRRFASLSNGRAACMAGMHGRRIGI